MDKRFGAHSTATSGVKVLETLLLEQKQQRFRYERFWSGAMFSKAVKNTTAYVRIKGRFPEFSFSPACL